MKILRNLLSGAKSRSTSARVPFVDLGREWAYFETDFLRAVRDFGRDCHYVLGAYVSDFEEHFAAASGYQHAVGVSSGLAALEVALLAEGIGPGDEVITAPNSAVATALAVSNIGARPVFCDIKDDFLLDEKQLEKLISAKTKAILPVHLFGRVADLAAINKIAAAHGLKVIEDACQAHGADFRGPDGLANTKAYSFYPTKNLGALGEAGLVLTNSEAVRDFARAYRDYGQEGRYNHVIKGNNYRIDALQCAFLDIKLKKLADFVAARRRIAQAYHSGLAGMAQLILGDYDPGSAYHLFVIRVLNGRRDALRAFLAEQGIETAVHYPTPIHRQPCYRAEFASVSLPRTEQLQKEILSLPCYPFLSDAEQRRVVDGISGFCRGKI